MMVAASKSLGKTQLRYLEALQLFLGILLNKVRKDNEQTKILPNVDIYFAVNFNEYRTRIIIRLYSYDNKLPRC